MSASGTSAPVGAATAAGKAPLGGAYAGGSLPFTGTDVLIILSLGTLTVLTGLAAHRLLARRGS